MRKENQCKKAEKSRLEKTKVKQKGITLIALVITIIVLLILAGVTIAAITSNESAPNKAVEARQKNEQGAEFDAIKLAAVSSVAEGNLDLYVDVLTLRNGLTGLIQENPEDVITGDGPWTVTSPSGRVYEINRNSTVNELTGLVLTPKSLTLTIEGDTYEEKIITARLIDIDGTLSWSNSTDIIDVTPSADGKSATIKAKKNGTETVTVTCSNGDTAECTVKVTKEMPSARSVLTLTNNKSPYVNYIDKNGNTITCRVLYNDNEHGLQIISKASVGKVGLGTVDDIYKNENSLTDLQKAQNSYNNAIEHLNDKAESFNNLSLSYDARCVGSVATISNNAFTNKDDEAGTQANGHKGTDTHYEEDYNKMNTLGILWDDNANNYWLASRLVSGSDFYVRRVWNQLTQYSIFRSYGDPQNPSLDFRPVFLLKSNVKISGGTGTSGDPYILETGE